MFHLPNIPDPSYCSNVLLSGFTFIRNAVKFDFPIRECVQSMLPWVDELVINVGRSEDGTEAFLEKIQSEDGNGKIRLLHSVWDDSKTKDGLILSEQTNIALAACKGRWALYLQADEALHESEGPFIRQAVEAADQKPVQEQPEGFRFRYLHFYGGYTLVQRPWNWYPSEIRILRASPEARSYGDAQSFRGADDRKLRTELLNTHVFHYGHARAPETMLRKINYFHRFWHGDSHGKQTAQAYKLDGKNLVWYWGTHPKAYAERVQKGLAWSPSPKTWLSKQHENVVIFFRKDSLEQRALADELARILTAGSFKVSVICRTRDWIKYICRHWPSRARNAVIDLDAEGRNAFVFPFWISDAWTAFSLRIAHAPRGKLSQARQKPYSAVHWTAHENAAEGFKVPAAKWSAQILRWLGLEI